MIPKHIAVFALAIPVFTAHLSCSKETPAAAMEQVKKVDAVDAVDEVDEVDVSDGGKPEQPIVPDPPQRPAPLPVIDFYPASHAGPDDSSARPKPVTVVLHGNFDRPEWECEQWKEAAGFYGWVLCPRGVRTSYATLKEDRWTYKGRAVVQKEIDAAMESLEALYPGRVSRQGTVLAGFSLGAIYAPHLAVEYQGRYEYLFLVEGGLEKLDLKLLKALKRSGIKSIGMAMSGPGRIKRARNLMNAILDIGLKTVFVDMKGAGHGYRDDFAVNGRAAMEKMVSSQTADAGTQGR